MPNASRKRGRLPGEAALVFPGVGVQLTGREAEFYRTYRRDFDPLFEAASVRAGIDLADALRGGAVDALSDERKQHFTFAFSCGVSELFSARFGLTPAAAAGYSFGIYGALFAARVITFEEGLRVIESAFAVMRGATQGGVFGMGIVVGLTAEELGDIIEAEETRTVRVTNTNHSLCHVYSGERAEILRFLDAARREGAFNAEPLPVDIPYHHPELLASAPAAFADRLGEARWRAPRFPVVSSTTAEMLRTPGPIVDFVTAHLASPVRWDRVVARLDQEGVGALFECGPGISLSQNGRFLPYEMTYINVKNWRRWQTV